MSTPILKDPAQPRCFAVGDAIVQPSSLEILFAGKTHRLEPKTLGVLARLAETPGQAVTRDELFAAVWPDTHVSEDVLNRCVYQLRRIFGDDPKEPQYIETIPKIGYRLIAAVGPSEPAAPASLASQPSQTSEPSSSEAHRSTRWLPFVITLLLAVGLSLALSNRVSLRQAQDTGTSIGQSTIGNPSPLRLAPLVVDAELPASVALDTLGRRVAYSSRTGEGDWNLFVRNLETGQTEQLTTAPANDHGPAWSPAGDELAWVRSDHQDQSCWLMRLSFPAGEERRILPCPRFTQPRLDWSPEGRHLVLTGKEEEHQPLRVHLIDLETGQNRVISAPPLGIAGDFGAVFSRDGRQVVFARSAADGQDDLFSLDLLSGDETQLTDFRGEISGFDLSPDGAAIRFTAVTDELAGLWSIALDGGEPQWLGYLGSSLSLLDFPAGSSRGALIRTTAQVEWLQTSLGDDGARVEPRSLGRSRRLDWFPALSPDGETLAWISDRLGHPEVWLRNEKSPNAEQRTSFDGPALGPPRWSPDGEQLVFDVRRGDSADLYRLELGHDRPTALTKGSGKNLQPHFSADGTSIVFASDRSGTWQLWRLPSGGVAGDEPASQLTTDGATSPVVSPRGDWIYFVRPGSNGLWRLSTDGAAGDQAAEPELWLEDFQPTSIENLFATSRGLFLVQRTSYENSELHQWDESSQQWRHLRDLGFLPSWPSVAIDRNASTIAWTHILETGSVIEAVAGLDGAQ